jgi:hypothetical protein
MEYPTLQDFKGFEEALAPSKDDDFRHQGVQNLSKSFDTTTF